MPKVAVVTDSTASLTPEEAARHGILVVPLQVVIGAHSYDDGVDPEASPESIAAALREYLPVSTSRPSPAVVLEAYERAAAEGAEAIVSVHLSAEVSATYESALLAAKESPVPVHPVDTRQIGAATGYAAVRAAEAVAEGADAAQVADVARGAAEQTLTLFYVDTLEYLRRGGRVGAAAALVGSALAVKPILEVEDGRVVTREKVRTSGRALAKLEELAVQAAGERPVAVTVSHLSNPQGAETLAESLTKRLEENLHGREVDVAEVGAVIGAHVGPGLVGVVVAPAPRAG
jgi:DegV family protein with EDD domain